MSMVNFGGQGFESRMLRTATLQGQPSNSNQRSYVDFNENGTYDPTEDRVIISDMDGNGQLNEIDAHRTSRALNLMRNRRQPDLNGDGRVSATERQEATNATPFGSDASRLDRDGDGRLNFVESSRHANRCGSGTEGVTFATDLNNDGNFTGNDLAFGNSHVVTGVEDGRVSVARRMPPFQTIQQNGVPSLPRNAGAASPAPVAPQESRRPLGQRLLRNLSIASGLANPATAAWTAGQLFNDRR